MTAPQNRGEKERLANRLVDATDFDRRFDQRFDNMAPLDPEKERDVPSVARARLQAVTDFNRRVVTAERLRPHMVAHYVDNFSEDELRELLAFYKSPVGRKYVHSWREEPRRIRDVLLALRAEHQWELDEALAKINRDFGVSGAG
jgi:hypothetical protein